MIDCKDRRAHPCLMRRPADEQAYGVALAVSHSLESILVTKQCDLARLENARFARTREKDQARDETWELLANSRLCDGEARQTFGSVLTSIG